MEENYHITSDHRFTRIPLGLKICICLDIPSSVLIGCLHLCHVTLYYITYHLADIAKLTGIALGKRCALPHLLHRKLRIEVKQSWFNQIRV